MTFAKKLTTATLLGLAAFSFSGLVLADETFMFNTAKSGSGDGNAWTYDSSGGYSVTATAWSDTEEISGSDRLETAQLAYYSGSGLGVRNRNGGNEDQSCCEHSMDNYGDDDFILFEFKNTATGLNQDVTLKSVDLGWLSSDSDLTILAFTNPAASSAVDPASGGLAGWRQSELIGANSGWTRIDLDGDGTSASLAPRSVGAGTITSSWWVVGAKFGDYNDYVKLASLVAVIPVRPPLDNNVPVPASIFLIAVGLVGIQRFRTSRLA